MKVEFLFRGKRSNRVRNCTVVGLMLLALTQVEAQDAPSYELDKGLPGITFGYSSDVPIIKEQSKVSTVLYPVSISIYPFYQVKAIDGVKVTRKSFRFINGSLFHNKDINNICTAIDLLPGKHTLSISYTEYLWVDKKRRKYAAISTRKPVDVEMEYETGCVYQIKAIIVNYNFMGFSIDKELTDPTIIDRLKETRNRVKE